MSPSGTQGSGPNLLIISILLLVIAMSDESDTSSDGEASGEEDNGVPAPSLLDPFYQRKLAGSNVSLAQHLCSAKISSIKGGESDSAFKRSLKLQNEAYGTNIPVNRVMELFRRMESESITYKFYCADCGSLVCTSSANKVSEVRGKSYDCGTATCQLVKVDLTGTHCDVMAILDAKRQLEMIYSLPTIEKMLTPLEELINRSERISDIYDGLIYKKITAESDVEDIILLHSADGLQIFEGGAGSVWTDLFQVANLKPEYRQKPEFMILTCVIYCKNGSPPKDFFKANAEETVDKIKAMTIEWNYRGEAKLSTVNLGFSVDDLPARRKVFECPHYASYYGCTFCNIKGRYAEMGRGGSVYFPADEGENLEKKTDAVVRRKGKEADFLNREAGRSDLDVDGYSGISAFSKLEDFNLVEQCVIDKMHCCYEGAMKKLLKFWFQILKILNPYMELIQDRLNKVHLTGEFTRTTIKIDDFVHWKANQLRTFTFVGPVVLAGILEEPYFRHFCDFSSGCHMLERDNLTLRDIRDAELKLIRFWSECPYDVNFVTMNVHCVGFHIADSVRYWGPFFVTSMFPFENVMNILKRFMCGTTGVSSQLSTKWMLKKYLELIEETVKQNNVRAKKMFDVAHGYKKLVDPIVTNFGVVMSKHQRQTKQRNMTQEENNNLRVNCGLPFDNPCQIYETTKIRKDGFVVTSMNYKEGQEKKKVDALVLVKKNDDLIVAAVEYFLTPVITQETVCIFKTFEFLQPQDADEKSISESAEHCWLMRQSDLPSSSCLLSEIKGKCILIEHRLGAFYVIKVPSLKAFE